MGRIVVTEFVSIDGVMEAPGGEPNYKHTNWVGDFGHGDHFDYKFREIMESEALLLGRETYESFAGAWPLREGEFADKMNAMPKFVVSTTLGSVDWHNTTLLQGDAVEAVRRLKADFDGLIQVPGSHTLLQTLKEADLVDEYHLMIFPIVLGSGFPMFEHSENKLELRLKDVRHWDNGIVVLEYVR